MLLIIDRWRFAVIGLQVLDVFSHSVSNQLQSSHVLVEGLLYILY
jgi:hypothetical protein